MKAILHIRTKMESGMSVYNYLPVVVDTLKLWRGGVVCNGSYLQYRGSDGQQWLASWMNESTDLWWEAMECKQ